MKKTINLLALILLFACIFTACSELPNLNKIVVPSDETLKLTAIDSAMQVNTDWKSPDNTDYDPDNREYARVIYDSNADIADQGLVIESKKSSNPLGGYDTNYVARAENIIAAQGCYRFTAMVTSNTNNVSLGELLELRVYRVSDGYNIAQKQFYGDSFTKTMTYLPLSVDFRVNETTEIGIELYSMNVADHRLASFEIKKISESIFTQQDVYRYLKGGKEAESSIDGYSATGTDKIYYFDLKTFMSNARNNVLAYDVSMLVTVLQGLVNRDAPRLFLEYSYPIFTENHDAFYYEELSQPGEILYGKEKVIINDVDQLLRLFAPTYVKGLVAWDQDVAATSNVAYTACGVEDYLPVRYSDKPGSLYDVLQKEYGFKVELDLHDKFKMHQQSEKIWGLDEYSTGSAKNDAYIWALTKYGDKTNATVLCNHMDAFSVDLTRRFPVYTDLLHYYIPQKDYFTSIRAFYFDLSVYDDDIPNDEPDQPYETVSDPDYPDGKKYIDGQTVKRILKFYNTRAGDTPIKISGYVPWGYKYTSKSIIQPPDQTMKHTDVDYEWNAVKQYGYYNAYKDAEVGEVGTIANVSVYSKVTLYADRTDKSGLMGENGPLNAEGNFKQPGRIPTQQELDAKLAELNGIRNSTVVNASSPADQKNYILLFFGDYDSAGWTNAAMPKFMEDPNRDKFPSIWTIFPNLAERIPQCYNYMYRQANDPSSGGKIYFVGGGNGIGYTCLDSLIAPDRPEGLNGSLQHHEELLRGYYKKFSIDVMGIMSVQYESLYDEVVGMVARLCPKGIGMSKSWGADLTVEQRLLEVEVDGQPTTVPAIESKAYVFGDSDARNFFNGVRQPLQKPTFTLLRSVLYSPTQLWNVIKEYNDLNVEFLDPYTFYYLYAQYYGG